MGRGRSATLTDAQLAAINAYLPAYVDTYNKNDKRATTLWKSTTVNSIYNSSVFAEERERIEKERGKNETGTENGKEIISKISKKFDNHISKVKSAVNKQETPPPTSDFLDDGEVTGWVLFGLEETESITAAATDLAAENGAKPLGRYQTSKKALWAALTDEKRADYEARAAEIKTDIASNQRHFGVSMFEKMAGICFNGRFGQMELVTLYAFREPQGAIRTGVINAHMPGQTASMQDECPEEWKEHVMDRWNTWVRKKIPDGYSLQIESDNEGLPIFPRLVLDAVTLAEMKEVLKVYFNASWAHSAGASTTVPWSDIAIAAETYYDTEIFQFPVQLRAPDSMPLPDLVNLTAYLRGLLDTTSAPFKFRVPAEKQQGASGNEEVGNKRKRADKDTAPEERPKKQRATTEVTPTGECLFIISMLLELNQCIVVLPNILRSIDIVRASRYPPTRGARAGDVGAGFNQAPD
ncbi:hypothetical protein B0H11DRAFT_2357842 [Mycena galericulata]|nr:hypothetical protein B0H11DRAFT_2357842 [Mycena galericulata]